MAGKRSYTSFLVVRSQYLTQLATLSITDAACTQLATMSMTQLATMSLLGVFGFFFSDWVVHMAVSHLFRAQSTLVARPRSVLRLIGGLSLSSSSFRFLYCDFCIMGHGFLLWEIFVLSVLLKFGPHFRTKNELALLPWEASKLPHGHTQ